MLMVKRCISGQQVRPQTALERHHLCARGYCVCTSGYDEQAVRHYNRNQEKADKSFRLARPPPLVENSAILHVCIPAGVQGGYADIRFGSHTARR